MRPHAVRFRDMDAAQVRLRHADHMENRRTRMVRAGQGVRFKHALSETVDFNADVYGRFSSNSVEKTESETTHYNNWQTANVAFGFEFGDEKQYTVAAEVLNLFDKRYRQDDSIWNPACTPTSKVGMRF